MQPPRFLALLMDVESCLSGSDKGLAVVQEGEPLLSLCKCLHANPVKNCWKIVDHRKQDCKSPQGIHWFIPLLPWGDLSYWREAVLKYPKNLSHALCVFSVYQEGFPDVSHCEGVLLGNVLLCCCTGQENDGESAPKLALLLAQAPAPSAQRPWALGRAGNPTGEPSKQRIFILCNVFCGDTHGPPWMDLPPLLCSEGLFVSFQFLFSNPSQGACDAQGASAGAEPMAEDAGGVHPLHPLLKHFWVI